MLGTSRDNGKPVSGVVPLEIATDHLLVVSKASAERYG
jgi:hypothetical protein